MSDKKDNNTDTSTKQGTNNVKVGNISKSAGVIIGSNIHVEGGINVTTVIQEIKSFGLKFLPPDYFQLNKSSKEDFDEWKNGFHFKLPNIMDGLHFQPIDIINEIIHKLDDDNGDHALLLLGKSGSSKSILLMDIMCHYFKKDFIVFYNFGEEEIKDVFELENSLITRLNDGNKILVAVDNVHDKKTTAIFSIIDSLRAYEEKKDNIRFILTGRQPEFDRFVNDRLDTVSEPVRQSIQNLYKQLIYSIPEFDLTEIGGFLEKYKNENDIKIFVNKNNYDYNKLFVEKDKVALNNISNFIYEKTKGDPLLVKFFIFGRGFAADVKSRFFNYLASDIKLHTMLVCIILDRAEIPISYDLMERMNLKENAFELTNETLTFLKNEGRWRTIHPKWDLELLAYLYNIEEYTILEKRKNLLRKALESLINNLSNEKDRFSILGSLYDSTTIDTEENRKFPITIVESIVTIKDNLINKYLSENSRYLIYSYYIARNYIYLQLYKKCLDATEIGLRINPNGINGLESKGIALDNLGQSQEAIKCYDEIITKLDPKYISAWNNKGLALGNLGQTEEEIKCYDEIITKLDPKYTSAWNNKGNALGNLGQSEEAIKCYDEIITKLDPKDVKAWYNKGVSLDRLGQSEEAIKCYDEIITKLDPKHVDAWYNKGVVLGNLGQTEEEIKCYDEIITKLDPKYVKAWNNKGNALGNLGQSEEAIKCYDEIITKLDPKHVNAWYNKGVSLDRLGQSEEAIKCYDEIITKLDPKHVNAWYNKGVSLDRLGQSQEAIKCYDEIITKLDPKHVYAWYNKGVVLGNLGQSQEAIKCYDEIITKLDPKDVGAWNNKGLALDRLGQSEEAIKCYDEIITKLDPKYVYAWYNKGVALDRLGQTEEEIKCYDEIITKLDPKYVYAWYNKGIVLGKLGRYEEAIQCFDEIIENLDPKYVDAWYNKGIVLNRLGQSEEAIKCYDEIITKLDPKHVNALNGKGWALDKLSRYQEAIEYYDKALKIDSNNKDVLDSKGYTFINLGKYEEAIEYFNKVLSIDSNHIDSLEHKKIAEEKLRHRNK